MILPSKKKLRKLRRKEIIQVYKKLKKSINKLAKEGDRDMVANFYCGYYKKYRSVEVASRLICFKDRQIKMTRMKEGIITPITFKW